jgi:hypothetical protein
MRTLVLAMCALLPTVLGCADRTHLTAGYGRSYHEAVARQTVNPDAGTGPVVDRGLDPQEASVIVQGYRASLAPKGQQTTAQEPMLIVSPSAQRGARSGDYMPPSSVPTER